MLRRLTRGQNSRAPAAGQIFVRAFDLARPPKTPGYFLFSGRERSQHPIPSHKRKYDEPLELLRPSSQKKVGKISCSSSSLQHSEAVDDVTITALIARTAPAALFSPGATQSARAKKCLRCNRDVSAGLGSSTG
ncbi:hypothetical protein EYF80_034536 [Liparis tanakae]|uniref:Uncharacterized protein n=1 Tax=Liparis tanakae TaxID=230148 RepID=A0A4Z2GPV8_9TELE|nr:hypothetical protein EYF80_034536 [Liparis tanakae]